MSEQERSEFLHALVKATGQDPNPRSMIGIALRRAGVSDSGDLLRILALPRRTLNVATTPDLTPLFRRPGSSKVLWPIQSAMLLECEAAQGLVGAVSVGGGKALTSFLLPYAVKSKRTVLFVPAARKKKTLRLIEQWNRDFRIPCDVLRVYSYNDLQGEAKADLLDVEQPDFIIADEAQNFRHKDTNRFRRLRKYVHENQSVRFAFLTGTLSKKSIKDYAHLVAFALKDRSPLPLEWRALEEWAEALDPSDDPLPPGALNKLCKEHNHVDHRSRYRCRLVSSVGVVATRESSFQGDIRVERRQCVVPPGVSRALQDLRETWQVKGGPEDAAEEVNDALTFARLSRTMAFGLYNRWNWPDGLRDEEWLSARADWNRTIRHVLRYDRSGNLDSPLRIRNAAIAGTLPVQHLQAWERWDAVRARRAPPSVPRWIDRFIVDDVKAWLEEGSIVWYDNVALGEEIAKTLDLPLPRNESELHCIEGPIVLSKNIFGTGLDGLQAKYHRSLYTFVPNAQDFEQITGRIAREGQTKAIEVTVYVHTPELEAALEETISVARVLEQREGQAQLLLRALESKHGL